MIIFTQSLIFLLAFNEFFFYFLIGEDSYFNIHNTYLIFFFLSLYINFFLNNPELKNRFDIDLVFKFFLFLIKTPNFLLNLFINLIKKIYVFLVFFKYRNFINTFLLLHKKVFKFFLLLWRPLFKKTSYFGFFRSNRSKWIK